jgi:hypothetical protein
VQITVKAALGLARSPRARRDGRCAARPWRSAACSCAAGLFSCSRACSRALIEAIIGRDIELYRDNWLGHRGDVLIKQRMQPVLPTRRHWKTREEVSNESQGVSCAGASLDGRHGVLDGAAFAQQLTIAIATGGTGGVYYPLGGGMANVLTKYVPGYAATARVTGGSVDNLKLIGSQQSEVALVMVDAALDALKGEDKFKGTQSRCAP